MWEEYPIARKSVKVPAEALEWSLASEEVVNPVCPMMNIQLDRRSQELVDLSTMSHGSTPPLSGVQSRPSQACPDGRRDEVEVTTCP
jgi:hypothetical protein